MTGSTSMGHLVPERLSGDLTDIASVTPAQVSNLLMISRSTVERLLVRGDLPSYKAGPRARRVTVADLVAFVNGRGGM